MSWSLVILAAVIAAPALVLGVGAAINITARGVRPLPSREGIACWARETAASLLMLPMLVLGGWEWAPKAARDWDPEAETQDVPVILVPGYALNRGTFLVLALYLRRRGWRWVWGLNNRPHSCPADRFVTRLSDRVDRVLAQTGASQVDLVGHSMGGALAAAYVVDHAAADKVRRIVSLGTPWDGTDMHVWGFRRQAKDLAPRAELLARARTVDVPLVGIWSESDIIVVPPKNARPPHGCAVHLPHIGHLDLLLNVRSLRVVARALRGDLDGLTTAPEPA